MNMGARGSMPSYGGYQSYAPQGQNLYNAVSGSSSGAAKAATKVTLPKDWQSKDLAGLQDLATILNSYGSGYDTASSLMQVNQEIMNQKTKKRETEIRGILDEVIGMYSPGGDFGKGTEAMLGREKEKSIAQGTQALVSSGLYNTTQQAGLGKKFEEEVGMPTRAKLEDVRYGQYAQALGAKAGLIEGIEQDPMDYAMLAQLMQTGKSY